MEKIGSFLSDEILEQVKSPAEYIRAEMTADLSLFPTEAQELIRGGIGGATPEEQSTYAKARNTWWEKKYGFPYNSAAARHELIMRKYASASERKMAHTLQNDLLDAFKNKDIAKIAELRKLYIEKYPDQLEGVESLFGLKQFFEDQSAIDVSVAAGEELGKRTPLYQNLTEYNFLLTDFIGSNGDDKAFLQKFWGVLEVIAREVEHMHVFQMLQRAIVTQVATGKIFEKLGEKTRLSHPSEDAFKSIDLWTDGGAIQIKGTSGKAAFLKTDTISFPGIEVARKDVNEQAKTYHINSNVFNQAQRFHAKLSEYRKLIKKDVEGYFLVIPYNKIDFITGEPAPDLVEFVKKQISTELK